MSTARKAISRRTIRNVLELLEADGFEFLICDEPCGNQTLSIDEVLLRLQDHTPYEAARLGLSLAEYRLFCVSKLSGHQCRAINKSGSRCKNRVAALTSHSPLYMGRDASLGYGYDSRADAFNHCDYHIKDRD